MLNIIMYFSSIAHFGKSDSLGPKLGAHTFYGIIWENVNVNMRGGFSKVECFSGIKTA